MDTFLFFYFTQSKFYMLYILLPNCFDGLKESGPRLAPPLGGTLDRMVWWGDSEESQGESTALRI